MIVVIKFPFLIGRIRTLKLCGFKHDILSFPFLIGRIRTERLERAAYSCGFIRFHSS